MNNTGIALRSGSVFVQGRYAGTVTETTDGYSFTYDRRYLDTGGPAVSLTLPLREDPFFSETLFPFFDGLIPEGWLLSVVTKNWKLDPKDRFGLLLVSCEDSIGDVSIRSKGQAENAADPEAKEVSER